MSKYIVEGGFDFFSELYDSLDNIDDNEEEYDPSKMRSKKKNQEPLTVHKYH